MKIKFTTAEETEFFINELMAKKTHVAEILELPNAAGYEVQYIEHKTYTAHDGSNLHDEVWVTKDGDMKLIQDIDDEHARNILRMLLRQEREAKSDIDALFSQIHQEIENDDKQTLSRYSIDDYLEATKTPPTLH